MIAVVIARGRHGTYATYKRGCRCTACCTYQRDRVKRNRAERLASGNLTHGARSAWDAGCRCAPCRAARIDAYRRLEQGGAA